VVDGVSQSYHKRLMDAPKCRICSERHWDRVCPSLTSSRGGDVEVGSIGVIRKERRRPEAPAGVTPSPREVKRGRPRIEDRGKPKPWETAGMSRASWYRRRAEKTK
jgi:hypothetical protein